MATLKKIMSACLAVSMLTAMAIPSMAAGEDSGGSKISIVTEINGNGVITESVGGEIKTSTYTTDTAATTPKTEDKTEHTETAENESDSEVTGIPDFDSPVYNTYLFKLIKAYVNYCIEAYNNNLLPEPTVTPKPTATPTPEATPTVMPTETPMAE